MGILQARVRIHTQTLRGEPEERLVFYVKWYYPRTIYGTHPQDRLSQLRHHSVTRRDQRVVAGQVEGVSWHRRRVHAQPPGVHK
jgi:hypothetical protein